jgi:serine/threonine protein kinase
MHRDIKMENILVHHETVTLDNGKIEKKTVAKIIDFGLAIVLLPHEKCTHAFGTLAYCSPEIILNHPHTNKTDIWSFGIVLHVMLTLRLPFLAHHKRHTSRNIVQQQLDFDDMELWGLVSFEGKDLVYRMLDKSQETRISIRQMLNHSWFKKMIG